MEANTRSLPRLNEGKHEQKLRGSVVSLIPHESIGKETMGGEIQSPGGPGSLLFHGRGRKQKTCC